MYINFSNSLLVFEVLQKMDKAIIIWCRCDRQNVAPESQISPAHLSVLRNTVLNFQAAEKLDFFVLIVSCHTHEYSMPIIWRLKNVDGLESRNIGRLMMLVELKLDKNISFSLSNTAWKRCVSSFWKKKRIFLFDTAIFYFFLGGGG